MLPARSMLAFRFFGLSGALLVCSSACSTEDTGAGGGEAAAGGVSGGSGGTAPVAGSAGANATGGANAQGGSSGTSVGGGGSGGANAGNAGSTSSGGAGMNSGGASGSSTSGTGGSGGPGTGGTNAAGAGGSGGASGGGGSSGSSSMPCMSSLQSGNSNRMLMIGGTSRSYVLHVPTSYTGMARVPLVLDFHGLGGSGMQQQSSSGFQQLADREGFLVAYPNGIDNAWNIGPCCTNSRTVDDLGFAKGIVADLASAGCVDLKRVYASGFSMGGGMSHFLGCNAPDVFAAVAPAAFDLLVPEEQPCAPSRPISVLAWRGTNDTVVPFGGGQGSSGRVTFLGAMASFERWSEIDGCTGSATTMGECSYYEQCQAGVQVGLCVDQGGSHAPGDANVLWTFLSKFTLP